jgi:hypothetical protein
MLFLIFCETLFAGESCVVLHFLWNAICWRKLRVMSMFFPVLFRLERELIPSLDTIRYYLRIDEMDVIFIIFYVLHKLTNFVLHSVPNRVWAALRAAWVVHAKFRWAILESVSASLSVWRPATTSTRVFSPNSVHVEVSWLMRPSARTGLIFSNFVVAVVLGCSVFLL